MSDDLRDHPPLRRADLAPDPIDQFAIWWARASEEVPLHDAMTLATVDGLGAPDARMVLLKGHGRDGFRFFTNYESAKAVQLDADPRAALNVYWRELSWQVRVRGLVERLDSGASDAYFTSRPRGSRLGAWASPQSRVLETREALEERLREAEERFGAEADAGDAGKGEEVPRPPFWGGYLLRHETVEFWQDGRSRLHDRLRYERNGEGWTVRRLGP